VDAGKQSVEVIGEMLPSLQQLTLDSSMLYSFRDLGTSLHSLQVLSVARSGITDLDGIGALACLQQLYAQHNRIADISPLSMHEELQVVGGYYFASVLLTIMPDTSTFIDEQTWRVTAWPKSGRSSS